ncbi:endonuclease MutS2 [Phorcysia thermohydrogeniphila]|uniref:Endonuclease MutS2 n=1 Tax=Phorcysia thermohydrogeniphila TaxID=936138 RepID=A0A4R1GB76_9BACT|nr:endonuclease MutS2 [Phorcysia thermohydrogeniphila]TCK05224.1 DNA mismatch repair protein MutS2 [Phorcysia thermohydrogeniphila]
MFKGVGRQLEFTKLLEATANLSKSEAGKRYVLSIFPTTNRETAEKNLQITDAFTKLLSERTIPLERFPDISPTLQKLSAEGVVLSVEELIAILKVIRQSSVLKKFFLNLDNRFERIKHFGERLSDFGELRERLEKTVDDSGEILDTASPKLRSIRRNIVTVTARIKQKLESLTNRFPEICPDRIITERDGRYVILVKPHFRSKFSGIVHDRSSSGQTLYVEPTSVVEDNNRLRELKAEEKEEIKRILSEISRLVAERKVELKSSFRALVEIDARQAVALMSLKLKGTLPQFTNKVELKNARHPLLVLQGKEVVPIDIELKNGLVITGPNTGGKTVALKTVGLLSMMAQSGFLIPAEEGSNLRFFKKWMADIGDEQSIEQSLSTFSAHVKNVAEILREADEDSLVLLDELGAGTDPIEGSALAIGILKYLKDRRAKVIVTTHFTPVKLFAWKDDYFEVASVLFDEKSLKPLYKLAYGIVGRSYAFVIAKRYGIPEEVIENARSLMTAEDRLAEDIIKILEKEYQSLSEKRAEVERLKEELERKRRELEEKEREVRERALKEIRSFIEELERKSQEVFKKAHSQKVRQEIKQIIVTAKSREEALSEIKPKREAKVGDTVKILKSGRKGKVIEIDKNRKLAKVLVGNLKVDVKLSQLEVVEETPVKQETVGIDAPKPKRFFPELKILGMRGEEALRAVEQFLDDASILGIKRVKIIHGHGEGILKRLVREYLKESPYVKSFRSGSIEEGGDGVTIVEL